MALRRIVRWASACSVGAVLLLLTAVPAEAATRSAVPAAGGRTSAVAHSAAVASTFPSSLCNPVMLYDVRGSGEVAGQLSGPGQAVLGYLQGRLPGVGITPLANGYPAVPVNDWKQALKTAQLGSSVIAGSALVVSDLKAIRAACQTSRVVVTAYSQGALALRGGLPFADTTNVDQVLLFGDPYFSWGEPGVDAAGGFSAYRQGLARTVGGLTTTLTVPITGKVAGRVLDVCHGGDIVCQTIGGTGPHMTYANDASYAGVWALSALRAHGIKGAPPATGGTAPCVQFVADLNYPDNSVVSPGTSLTKSWRLLNCGTTSWSGVSAVRVSGSFGPATAAVPAAAPGATVTVNIPMVSPSTTGTATSTYGLQSPAGLSVNNFWAQVYVQPAVASAGCVAFVADLTYPDNAKVAPGTTVNKTWRLRNCGTTSWAGLTAVQVGGSYGPNSFGVPAIAPGATADVTVSLAAPSVAGIARSTYRLRTANGTYAANSFWVQLAVTATTDCAVFVADLTVPDGTVVTPGATLDKTWRLKNCGTSDWSGLAAVRVLGTYGPERFAVPTVAPGGTTDVTVTMTGPTDPGTSRASYALQTAAGRTVGSQFWVEVVVPQPPGPGREGVVSYDRMKGGAPYHGYFDSAYQGFVAASNRITTIGVTVGNPTLPAGQPVGTNLTVKLCADPGCAQVLGQAAPQVVNYGNSVADLGDVPVTKGTTYYAVWYQPPAVNDTTWVTYWWSGGSSITTSDQMQAVVRGYDNAPLGDLTGDGFVGCADQAVLLGNLGKTPAGMADGDLNGDDVVTVADLSVMLSHWSPPPGDPQPGTPC